MESKGSLIGNKVILNKDVASRNMISDAFSESKSYAVGDTCIYENKLYKCKIATSGAWDATKWDETTVGAYVSELKGTLVKKTAFLSGASYTSIKLGETQFNSDVWLMVNVYVATGKYLRVSLDGNKVYEFYLNASAGNALTTIPVKSGQTVKIETNDSNITSSTECAKAFAMIS